MANYWENQTEGFSRGLGSLAGGLAQIPRIKAQAQARQQQLQIEAQREQAYAAESAAHSGLYRAQTDEAGARTKNTTAIGNWGQIIAENAAPAIRAMQAGKLDDPAVDRLFSATSALTGMTKGDVAKSVKENLGTVLALAGNNKMAASVQDPVSVNNNQVATDERGNRPLVVPGGGSLVSPTGTVLANALAKQPAKSGATSYQTETTEIPATEGSPEIPAAPESGWGPWHHDAVAGKPAVPAAPKKTITKRIPIEAAVQTLTNALTATNQPAGSPATGSKVRVQHPNGSFGFIPAEQVQDALSQGFKLAQ